jgi:hypothetical protein
MVEQGASLKLGLIDDGFAKGVGNISTQLTTMQIGLTATGVALPFLEKGLRSSTSALVIGAKNADDFARNMRKVISLNTELSTIIGKASNIAFYVQQFALLAKGASDAYVSLKRIPETLEQMQRSGVSTDSIQGFMTLRDAISGSQVAVESFAQVAVAKLNAVESASARVGTILKSSTEFTEAGTAKRATATDLNKNRKQIQSLLRDKLDNSVTTTEALLGQYEVLSGGFTDTKSSQQVLEPGLKLIGIAGAGGQAVDPTATLQLLTKTLRAYGLEASQATRVSAILNGTVENGITTIQELSQTFGQASQVAKTAGISIEDLAAATSVLTAQGTSTPVALTGIQALARSIIDKTPEAAKEIAKLRDSEGKRIRFDIREVQEKGLAKSIQDVFEATGGDQTKLAQILPDTLAYRTALGLSSNKGQDYKNVTAAIKANANAQSLDEVAKTATDDRISRFQKIANRFEETIIQLGESLAPVFEPGLAYLEKLSKFIANIPDPVKKAIASYLLFKIQVNSAGIAFKQLVGAIVPVITNLALLRVTSLALSGQLGKQIGIIKELIIQKKGYRSVIKQMIGIDQSHKLAIAGKTEAIKGAKSGFLGFAETIRSTTVGKKIEEITEKFTGQKEAIKKLAETTQKYYSGLKDVLGSGVDKVKGSQPLEMDQQVEAYAARRRAELEKNIPSVPDSPIETPGIDPKLKRAELEKKLRDSLNKPSAPDTFKRIPEVDIEVQKEERQWELLTELDRRREARKKKIQERETKGGQLAVLGNKTSALARTKEFYESQSLVGDSVKKTGLLQSVTLGIGSTFALVGDRIGKTVTGIRGRILELSKTIKSINLTKGFENLNSVFNSQKEILLGLIQRLKLYILTLKDKAVEGFKNFWQNAQDRGKAQSVQPEVVGQIEKIQQNSKIAKSKYLDNLKSATGDVTIKSLPTSSEITRVQKTFKGREEEYFNNLKSAAVDDFSLSQQKQARALLGSGEAASQASSRFGFLQSTINKVTASFTALGDKAKLAFVGLQSGLIKFAGIFSNLNIGNKLSKGFEGITAVFGKQKELFNDLNKQTKKYIGNLKDLIANKIPGFKKAQQSQTIVQQKNIFDLARGRQTASPIDLENLRSANADGVNRRLGSSSEIVRSRRSFAEQQKDYFSNLRSANVADFTLIEKAQAKFLAASTRTTTAVSNQFKTLKQIISVNTFTSIFGALKTGFGQVSESLQGLPSKIKSFQASISNAGFYSLEILTKKSKQTFESLKDLPRQLVTSVSSQTSEFKKALDGFFGSVGAAVESAGVKAEKGFRSLIGLPEQLPDRVNQQEVSGIPRPVPLVPLVPVGTFGDFMASNPEVDDPRKPTRDELRERARRRGGASIGDARRAAEARRLSGINERLTVWQALGFVGEKTGKAVYAGAKEGFELITELAGAALTALGPIVPIGLAIGAAFVFAGKEIAHIFGFGTANAISKGIDETTKALKALEKESGKDGALLAFKANLVALSESNTGNADALDPLKNKLNELKEAGNLTSGQFTAMSKAMRKAGEDGKITAQELSILQNQIEAFRAGAPGEIEKGIGDRIGEIFSLEGLGRFTNFIGNLNAAVMTTLYNPQKGITTVAEANANREGDRLIKMQSKLRNETLKDVGDNTIQTIKQTKELNAGLFQTEEARKLALKGSQVQGIVLEKENKETNDLIKVNELLISGYQSQQKERQKLLDETTDTGLKQQLNDQFDAAQAQIDNLQKRTEALKQAREQITKYYNETLPVLQQAVVASSVNPLEGNNALDDAFSVFKEKYIDEGKVFLKDVQQQRTEGQAVLDQILQNYDRNLLKSRDVANKVKSVLDESFITLTKDGRQIKGSIFDIDTQKNLISQIAQFNSQATAERISQIELESSATVTAEQLRRASEEDVIKRTSGLQQEKLGLQKKQLESELELRLQYGIKVIDLENQLKQINLEIAQAEFNAREKLIQKQLEQKLQALNTEKTLISAQVAERGLSEEDAQAKVADLQIKEFKLRANELKRQLNQFKANGVKNVELENEYAQTRNQIREAEAKEKNRLKDLDFETQRKQLENENQRADLRKQALESEYDLLQKQAQLTENITSSRNQLADTESRYVQSQLQNQAKLTRDPLKQAEVELRVIKEREVDLVRTQKAELESLATRQKLLDLDLKRQVSQIELQELEAESQAQILKFELERATKQKRSPEEIEAIKLQIQGNKQRTEALTQQLNLTNQQVNQQGEINKNEQKRVRLTQQIESENAKIEKKLAKQKLIQEQIDKVTKSFVLSQQQIQQGYDKQTSALEKQNTIIGFQKQLLEARQRAFSDRLGIVTSELGLASQLIVNEKQRQVLAQSTATIKLKALDQQQKAEREVLLLNQQQAKVQGQIDALKLKGQQAQNKAEVAQAQADLAKLEASGATPEEIAAGQMNLEAKLIAGQGLALQASLLPLQSQLLDYSQEQEIRNLDQRQKLDRMQAKSELANTLPEGRQQAQLKQQIINEALSDVYGKKVTDWNYTSVLDQIQRGDQSELNRLINGKDQETMRGRSGSVYIDYGKPPEVQGLNVPTDRLDEIFKKIQALSDPVSPDLQMGTPSAPSLSIGQTEYTRFQQTAQNVENNVKMEVGGVKITVTSPGDVGKNLEQEMLNTFDRIMVEAKRRM